MNTIREPHVSCNGQTVSDAYRKWVFEHMPRTGALLDILDSGATPTFLDIMGGLSDCVAFYTEGDLKSKDHCEKIFTMSGKLCRFCC